MARGAPALIDFGALVVFSRLVVPAEYGKYALVIGGIMFANALLFNWLRLALVRFLPTDPTERRQFLGTLLAGFGGMAVVTAVLGLAGVGLVRRELAGYVAAGVVLLMLKAWYELNLEYQRAQLRPEAYGRLGFLKSGTAASVGAVLAWLGFGAYGLLVGLGTGLAAVIWYTRSDWSAVTRSDWDWATLKSALHYGLPLTVTFTLGTLIVTSDRALLAILEDVAAAGVYALAYDFTRQTLVVLMSTVNLAAFPLVVRALEDRGVGAAREQLSINLTTLLAIALPATTGIVMLSENLAGVFFGAEFEGGGSVVIPLIAVATLIAGTKSHYLDHAFQLARRTILQVWVVLAAAVVNIGVNIWLIPILGVVGAAVASIVGFTVGAILSFYVGRRTFRLPFPTRDLAGVIGSTAVMAGALWPVREWSGTSALFVQVLIGLVGYFVAAFLFDVAGIRRWVLHGRS